MKLKVCGVNDAAFACAAARLGADYLGFIFEVRSPRGVAPDVARRLAAEARRGPSRPRCVGVFTRQTVEEVRRLMAYAGLDVVQLHRRAREEEVAALRAAGYEVWALAGGAPGDGVLFDSSHGDGETQLRRGPWRTILAGGISVANLAEAVRAAPDVIDVSGSLESARGVKSIPRLRAFMRAWRARSGSGGRACRS
ncbi:MAG: phosphoribosylanthranilate isomerase [Kiritimatiellia bacterium]